MYRAGLSGHVAAGHVDSLCEPIVHPLFTLSFCIIASLCPEQLQLHMFCIHMLCTVKQVCCSGFQVVTPEISKMCSLCLLFREYAKKCVFLFNRHSFRYISWSLQMVSGTHSNLITTVLMNVHLHQYQELINLTKGYLWNHYSTNVWIKVLKCKCNLISPL